MKIKGLAMLLFLGVLIFGFIFSCYLDVSGNMEKEYRIMRYGKNGYKVQWKGEWFFGYFWHDVTDTMFGYIESAIMFKNVDEARKAVEKYKNEDVVFNENAKIGWFEVQ